MIKVSPARIVGCFAAVVVLVGALLVPGTMRTLARFEGAPEKWWRTDSPQFAESFAWSAWRQGAGELRAPPLAELKDSTIAAYRIGTRVTFFKSYTYCQARYLSKDSVTKIGFAACPVPYVVVRENRAELLAGFSALAGFVLLGLCIWWPNRRMQPTPTGAPDPGR